ncbi:MAG: restriction endonuclease subunit S, partial [Gemmataceae bacterium]
ANAEQNLKNAKELFESYLLGVFENKGEGWEEKALGEVCDFENGDRGKNYPNKSRRVENGIPFINAGHLNDNKIDFSEMDYISEERLKLLGNGKIKPNDILFCLRGSLGKVANVGNLENGAIASSLVIIRVRKELDNDFLLYFLSSNLTTNQIVDFGNGAAQPNLSAGSLKKFIIPLPKSLKEQQTIVQKLDALSTETKKLEAIYQQKLNDLEELKKSVLQKAFSGELVIKNETV